MIGRGARSAGAPTRRLVALGGAMAPLIWAAGAGSAGAGPREGRWMVASSANFNVYSDGDERMLRDYTLKLEDFDMTLRLMSGLPMEKAADRKLDIHLVGSRGTLRVTYPDAGENLMGYYVATARDVTCVAIRGSARDAEADDITLHEYAHHFMKRNFNYAYAPWFVEGYAEYVATTTFDDDKIIVGKFNSNRASWLMGESWLPLGELLTKRPGEVEGDRGNNYYPQAWLLTHYLMGDKDRQAQLTAYLRAVGDGQDSVAAMEKATGMSLPLLTKALRAYTRTNLPVKVFSRKRKREVPIEVSRLPVAADELLLPRVRMAHDDFEEGGAVFVDGIRRIAGRYPGDPFAELTLARAEQLAGDPVAGMAILDRVLAADPGAPLALEYKALGLLAQAQKEPDKAVALNKAAGSLLGKVFQTESNRYQVLLAFAQSRKLSPGYPSDNVMEALLLANELAPQVSDVTIETVNALAMRRQYARAAMLLKPLANDPHARQGRDGVARLLAQLEAKAAAEKSGA